MVPKPAPSTLVEMGRILKGADFAAWRDVPLTKINKRDVLNVLDGIKGRGAERQANKTLVYLNLFFKWSRQRDYVSENPVISIDKPGIENDRDRVLYMEELRLIWKSTEGDDTQFNSIVRLLMLTGQRLNEVAQMRWSEINTDRRLWTLPAERAKNGREHLVPLTDPMIAILEARKAIQTALVTINKPMPRLVFTTTGTTPFSGFSRGKELLDKRINILLAEADQDADPAPAMEPWRLHDIRRSFVTHCAEKLRIAPHILEATINHISGTKSGVAGIYNRALYLDERRDALEAWSRHLLDIVGDAKP